MAYHPDDVIHLDVRASRYDQLIAVIDNYATLLKEDLQRQMREQDPHREVAVAVPAASESPPKPNGEATIDLNEPLEKFTERLTKRLEGER
jgi:hypothetical protein